MIYIQRAANSLKRNHAEFWRQVEQASPEYSSRLLEGWALFVSQAQRLKLDPETAAARFVEKFERGFHRQSLA